MFTGACITCRTSRPRNTKACAATIARFLNAASEDEIVMNSGTTEGINTVAYGWAMPRMEAGDEIVLSVMEHHANIVPWHFLRERQGVVLKWVDVDETGALPPEKVLEAIGPKTKLVAITHLSNVLGTRVDVKAICDGGARDGCAGAGRRFARGGACPGRCAGHRVRFLRDHGPQALWSLRDRARSISARSGRPRCAPSWAAAT